MHYAQKQHVLNINFLIVSLFGVPTSGSTQSSLAEINNDLPICDRLSNNITQGGIKSTEAIRSLILEEKMEHSYLQIPDDPTALDNNILKGPDTRTNTLFITDTNKCKLFSPGSNKEVLCNNSKNYETSNLNALDLNAQYLCFKMLNELDNGSLSLNQKSERRLRKFHKELEFRCMECVGFNYENKRAEPEYIQNKTYDNTKNGFFSFEEAEDNYKWLVKFVFDNKIPMDDDFIFEGVKYLKENSEIFTEDLKNSHSPEPPQPTDPIACPYPISQFEEMEVDLTPLNDYVLKKQNCNMDYMNNMKDSYL